MSRLILDVSTLVRWAGPPVGIARVENETAIAALAASLPVELAFFDPSRQAYRSLAPAWAGPLLGWHAAIDPFGLDSAPVRHGWRRLMPSRGGIMRRLERMRLLASGPRI